MAAKFLTTGGKHTFSGFNEQVTIRANPSLDKKSMDFGPENENKETMLSIINILLGQMKFIFFMGPSMMDGRIREYLFLFGKNDVIAISKIQKFQ